MKRKLFCEISPLTYKISTYKEITIRHIQDWLKKERFAQDKAAEPLPVCVYTHNSLIRRKLGNVNLQLQENKAINLSIAAPKVTNILIKPQETFSFWHLVGSLDPKKGYKEGLTIANDSTSQGIGGGMCQFTNLIHWMVLHSPLIITEHHHHDNLDLFPDYGRQVPFGTGTSIVYNYLDYRFKNPTPYTFQLIVYTNEKYLCGELRCDHILPNSYHIKSEDEYFSLEEGIVYRNNKVYRRIVDKVTGKTIKKELIKANHARVLYDTSSLDIKRK
ncbi:MAG: VanW family protein [Erysipelotrichaceae bacterium]|nr:VanW family protein [Erysipelotrichaceae bacterium]MDY5252171.1 VanW family protein [Erysipelotrichaceae bacterium]